MNRSDNNSVAVFIDGGWLYGVSRRINKKIDYAVFYNNLVSNFGPETKIYFYSAVFPDNKQQIRFYNFLKKIGYIVRLTKVTKINDKFVTKGLEIELAVNATQILPSLKKFVLVSGDSDFIPLLKQAANYGVRILLVAFPFSTGYLLRKVVGGEFLNIETLIRENEGVKKLPILKNKQKEALAKDSLYIEKGDYFGSYLEIRNLMISAKDNILIIDSYVDDQILTMIKLLERKIKITIFTQKPSPADFCIQVKKLRAEGYCIVIHKTNIFHDRFIGVDDIWWHSGHSFKDLGNKDSMLNKVIEKKVLSKLKDRVAEEVLSLKEIC